eukprot:873474-Rhodomonas_salina.1
MAAGDTVTLTRRGGGQTLAGAGLGSGLEPSWQKLGGGSDCNHHPYHHHGMMICVRACQPA